MKKKLFLILTIMVVSLFALSLSKVSANDVDPTINSTTGSTIVTTQNGAVTYVKDLKHADEIDIRYSEGNATTADTVIHIKGYVTEIYRARLVVYSNGETIYDDQGYFFAEDKSADSVKLRLQDNYFEYHGNLGLDLAGKNIDRIKFQIYTTNKTENRIGEFQLLGIHFDTNQTYDGFSGLLNGSDTPVEPDTPVTPEPTPDPEVPAGEYVFAGNEVTTLENNVATLTTEEGRVSVALAVSDVSNVHVSLRYKATGISVIQSVAFGEGEESVWPAQFAPAGWNVKVENCEDGSVIATANVSSYVSAFTSLTKYEFVLTGEAGATLEILGFAVTADGNHGLLDAEQGGEDEPVEPDDGTLKISGITTDAAATITTPEDGWQLVSYETSPGYALFTINVKNYDANAEAQIFEIKFTPSEAATICFAIGDPEAGIDWSLGHASYAGGRTSKYSVDLSNYTLESNFNIYMYIDAASEVTAAKSILFNSVEIKAPVAEPEGMYLTDPAGHSLSVSGDATEGWYVSYNNDAASWRYVLVEVKNHEVEYDIVRIKVDLAAGTNLGIRLYWTDAEGATVYTDLRDHWASSGVAKESKTYDLVYLLSSYNASGYVLSKMELYFDPATEFTTNTGDVEALIHSVELLKSSDYTFGELEFTASDLTVDYNGEAVNLNVNCEQNVEFLFEHAVPVTEGELKWNKGLPVNAGSYIVKVKFMGSLEYAAKSVEVNVTINMVKATVNASDVTVDASTRVVTVSNGVIASTDADFTEGYEVVNGDTVPYGTVIYYKHPGNENMTESDVLTLTVERPVDPQPEPTPDPDPQPQPEPTPEAPANNGCGGSVVASILGVLTLAGACIVLRKKREE